MERKTTILIVDNEKILRDSLEDFLKSLGYIVTSVGSGSEAINQIKERAFDLVLLDEFMPEMDGLVTLQRILRIRPDTVVIGLTGEVKPQLYDQFVHGGAYTVLPKSEIYKQKFLEILEKALRDNLNGCSQIPKFANFKEAATYFEREQLWELAAVNYRELGYDCQIKGEKSDAYQAYNTASVLFRRAGRATKAREAETLAAKINSL